MTGYVDLRGRAMVRVSIRPSNTAAAHELEVWIDTGFNGDLVLPQEQIDHLALPLSGTVKALLADGSEIVLETFACAIDWFGERRHLEVVANNGECPLLGVGLLLHHDLHISYRTGKLEID
ncbi:MAG: hypothetical protein ACOCWL_00570 [Thermoguttaceae bacterium]